MATTDTNAGKGEDRRDKIVAFIREFHEERGYYPSIREIAKGVGLDSAGSTHRQLTKLIDAGRVRREQVSTHLIIYAPVE